MLPESYFFSKKYIYEEKCGAVTQKKGLKKRNYK